MDFTVGIWESGCDDDFFEGGAPPILIGCSKFPYLSTTEFYYIVVVVWNQFHRSRMFGWFFQGVFYLLFWYREKRLDAHEITVSFYP